MWWVRIDELWVQHIKSSIFVDSNAIIQESQGVYWYTFFRGIYLFDHSDCSRHFNLKDILMRYVMTQNRNACFFIPHSHFGNGIGIVIFEWVEDVEGKF